MKTKSTKVFLSLLVAICILLSQTIIGFAASDDIDMQYFKGIMDMIKEKYKGDLTDKQLIEGALKGMFDSMDPYTTFYTPKEADDFLTEMNGSYGGIGIMMEKSGDYIIVNKVFPMSPAEKAGVVAGDKLVEADGKSLIGSTTDEVASLIRGESGTKVTVGVIKNGSTEVTKIEFTREIIKINPVSYEIKGDIGYIKLEVFNSNSDEFMKKALEEMDKNNITKLILDLRNNPGGEVGQVVSIARSFVPKGLITRLDFKSPDIEDTEYHSYLEKPKYKLAVLVNGMSASASEILSGAIQDTKAGTLIGTKTFGKAKVQNIYPLLTPEAYKKYETQFGEKFVNVYDLLAKHNIDPPDDEIVGWTKITTGEYTTPNGRMIDKVGLTPDITIDDYKVQDGIDVNTIGKLKKTSKLTLGSEGTDVYSAERILKLSGYDVNTPDTKLDEKTFNAVGKFQKDNGLYPYGVLDLTTQQALNNKLEKLVLDIDTQYAKALEVLNKN